MSITIFDIPISIIVIERGKEINAFALYVESGGPHSNDIWTCAHEDTGKIRHYTTAQIKYPPNQTFNVISNERKENKGTQKSGKKPENNKSVRKRRQNP